MAPARGAEVGEVVAAVGAGHARVGHADDAPAEGFDRLRAATEEAGGRVRRAAAPARAARPAGPLSLGREVGVVHVAHPAPDAANGVGAVAALASAAHEASEAGGDGVGALEEVQAADEGHPRVPAPLVTVLARVGANGAAVAVAARYVAPHHGGRVAGATRLRHRTVLVHRAQVGAAEAPALLLDVVVGEGYPARAGVPRAQDGGRAASAVVILVGLAVPYVVPRVVGVHVELGLYPRVLGKVVAGRVAKGAPGVDAHRHLRDVYLRGRGARKGAPPRVAANISCPRGAKTNAPFLALATRAVAAVEGVAAPGVPGVRAAKAAGGAVPPLAAADAEGVAPHVRADAGATSVVAGGATDIRRAAAGGEDQAVQVAGQGRAAPPVGSTEVLRTAA